MTIKRCPIIPIKQHPVYNNGVDAKLLKLLPQVRSPKYVLDSALCYAKLKVIGEKPPLRPASRTSARPAMSAQHIRNFSILFLAWFIPNVVPDSSKRSFAYSKVRENSNFQTYISCHEKIFQQMENIQNNGYAGIDAGTQMRYFLWGIDKPSLKTAVQICKSKDTYSIFTSTIALLISRGWCKSCQL